MPIQWTERDFGHGPEPHAVTAEGHVKVASGFMFDDKIVKWVAGIVTDWDRNAYLHLTMFCPPSYGNHRYGSPGDGELWKQIQNCQIVRDGVPFHLTEAKFKQLAPEAKAEAFMEARRLGEEKLKAYAETVLTLPPNQPELVLHALMRKIDDILLDDIACGAAPGESDIEKSAGYVVRRVAKMLEKENPDLPTIVDEMA